MSNRSFRGILLKWVSLFVALSAVPYLAPAQNAGSDGSVTLRGTVTGQDDQPVPGATIRNLTEKSYTTSDADGKYTLYIKDASRSVIEFSFIGMDKGPRQPVRVSIQISVCNGHRRCSGRRGFSMYPQIRPFK